MEQWDRDTASIQNVARDNYDKTKLIIDELYKDGVIPWSELQDRDKKAWEKYQNTINSELQEIHVNMTKLFPPDQLQIGISTFVGTIKGVFDQTAHESGNFGKNLVKNLLTALEDRAIFNAIEAIGSALSDALTGATGAGGANESQGILAGVISGFFGPQGAGHASGGFVTGGQSYMVGERGPEMFTPGASGWVSPNGSGMVFAPTYHIVAPNGDQQLRAALPGLLSQTAARSKQDMLEAFRRNNLRAPARA
jgi:phage-related minor tail protein